MGIIRKYENIARHMLTSKGAAIGVNDAFKVLRFGKTEDISPAYANNACKFCIEYEIGDYVGHLMVVQQDLAAFWKEMHDTAYTRALVIRKTSVTCIHDILDDINEYTLLDFKPEDIVNTPIPDGTYTKITITTSPSCFWFTGSLDIPLQFSTTIVEGKPVVKLPVSSKINSIDNDPTASTASHRYSLAAQLYGVNFNAFDKLAAMLPYKHYCNSIQTAAPSAQITDLIQILKNDAGVTAVSNQTANYPGINLYQCRIVYNGPVEGYCDIHNLSIVPAKPNGYGAVLSQFNKPRQDREYVLVIIPDVTYSSTLRPEPVFIHYGGAKPVRIERPPVHYWPLRKDRVNRGASADKPMFRARGEFTTRDMFGRSALVINQGDSGGPAGKAITPIGVDLPADKDFTISFDYAANYYKTTIASTLYLTSLTPDGADKAQNYFIINGCGNVEFKCDLGSPRLTITHPTGTINSWPHWVTLTFVRRGNRITVYRDGYTYMVFHDIQNKLTSFDSFMTYYANQAPSVKEFRYFDYALDAQQVKDAIVGKLDPVIEPSVPTEQPKPVHLWSLDGHGGDIGTSPVTLASVFSYREESPCTDGKQFAYNTVAGGSKLGVELDVSKDFTIAFDLAFYNPPSGYDGLGDLLSGNGTHTLSFHGTSPYLKGVGTWESTGTSDRLVSTLTKQTYRIQLVRKGDWVSYFLNGRYLRTQKWLDKTTTKWDRFGGPSTLSSYLSFRNLTYYDMALTDEQLVAESIDRVGVFTDDTPVTIPEPVHYWKLQDDLVNNGLSGKPMTAPFKFVERDTGKWATLSGGRVPQAFGPGIEMARSGDWIIDFELMVLSGPERNALLVTHVGAPWMNNPSVLALYYNKPYEVYGSGSDNHTKTLTNGVPARLTYRCTGGVTTLYMDGVKVVQYSNPTTGSFKGFRTTDGTDWFPSQMPENNTFIRKLGYWDTAMSKREFEALLKRK